MSFKPFRDSRPMAERPLEIQAEAAFFQRIQPLLTKKQQGHVMGAFRDNLKNFPLQDSRSVWLLYMVNYENRSGEDFVHAFVGFPALVQLCDIINFTPEDYALLKAGKETTGLIKYFIREQ